MTGITPPGLALILAIFVFVAGPTILILNLLPTTLGDYAAEIATMSARSAASGDAATESWLSSWTIFYWAWWISWTPFVGMFLARISRGRTIRQFVVGVIVIPTTVSLVWFAIFGGAAIGEQQHGIDLLSRGTPESQLFGMLDNLPIAGAFLQWPMDSSVVADVFRAVSLPGRFEFLRDTPLIVADCAHNEAAALALRPLVDSTTRREGRRVLLCGLTIGRDPYQFLANLGADRFDDIVVTEPDTPRAQSCNVTASAAAPADVTVRSEPAISRALQVSTSLAGKSGLVVVVGSHYLVGPVRELVRP